MAKYQNKYRTTSARAKWWNYANDGVYFITICTADRLHLFGEIKNAKMHFSDIGEIANYEWNKSFDIRTELFCDVSEIMPNHIHALLRIVNDLHNNASNPMLQNPDNTPEIIIPNHGIAIRAKKSISSFVAGFKSSATKQINELRNTPKLPVWQPRFHDHIVRNRDEYERIYRYIKNNPATWERDRLNKYIKSM